MHAANVLAAFVYSIIFDRKWLQSCCDVKRSAPLIFFRILGFYPRPEGRSWHTLSALDDNRFFLYGGYTQTEDVLGNMAGALALRTACDIDTYVDC